MNTVEDIAEEEAALKQKMPVDGHIEDRDRYLRENGLYDEWRDVYKKYVALAEVGNLEALKRAVFYAWYQLSEPGWLSGISELPEEQTRKIIFILEERLSEGLRDEELELMLPYYMSVCGYYLERFYPLPAIQNVSVLTEDIGRPTLTSSTWTSRGQMGGYWGA